MEEDELSMDEEELQRWIGVQVGKAELISPGVLQRYHELHRLLEKRQNQTIQMLQLCRSLTACENVVRELYAGLGWDYEDLDSSDGNKPPDERATPLSSVCSENLSSPSLQSPKTQNTSDGPKRPHIPDRKPVIVLTRLSRSQLVQFLQTQNPSVLQNGERDRNEESEGDSPIADSATRKKRKRHHRNQNLKEGTAKRNGTETGTPRPAGRSRGSAGTDVRKSSSSRVSAGTDVRKSSSSRVSAGTDVRKSSSSRVSAGTDVRKSSSSRGSAGTDVRKSSSSRVSLGTDVRKSSSSRVSLGTDAESNATKQRRPASPSEPENATTPPAAVEKTGRDERTRKQAENESGVTSAKPEGTKAPAKTPLEEPTPNMRVIARKAGLQWKLGKIVALVTKGEGRMKYKINFDKKGRSLVSGHHIAFESRAKVDQLEIGSRVVVQRGEEYLPGILGEMPSRKNRMRFLVFTDDGAAVYVGLPLMHMVCRPLEDPLEDIQDESQRSFIQQYLKDWPYPPQSQYKMGQILKVERQGTQQNCEVLLIDSSLVKVVFQSDQHVEWIYRGSLRMDNMLKWRGWLVSKDKNDEK